MLIESKQRIPMQHLACVCGMNFMIRLRWRLFDLNVMLESGAIQPRMHVHECKCAYFDENSISMNGNCSALQFFSSSISMHIECIDFRFDACNCIASYNFPVRFSLLLSSIITCYISKNDSDIWYEMIWNEESNHKKIINFHIDEFVSHTTALRSSSHIFYSPVFW